MMLKQKLVDTLDKLAKQKVDESKGSLIKKLNDGGFKELSSQGEHASGKDTGPAAAE
jgi:hypothetical protein